MTKHSWEAFEVKNPRCVLQDGFLYYRKEDVEAFLAERDREVMERVERLRISGRTMEGFTGEVSTTRIDGYNHALNDVLALLGAREATTN